MRGKIVATAFGLILGLALGTSAAAETPGAGDGVIAFLTDRTGDREIYAIRDDGTGLVNVSNSPGTDRFPAISPAGTLIAYASDRTGTWGIYLTEIDPETLTVGATMPVVIGTTDSTGYWSVDWDLDGEHLYVESRRQAVHRVDRVSIVDGSWTQWIPTTLASGETFDAHNPQISVDGSQIYVFRNPPFNGWAGDVYVYDADGTNERRLTSLPGVQTY